MRIAYVCSDFGVPIAGTKGASAHVRELTSAFAELGHEVQIFTPRAGGSPPPGFRVPVRELAPEGYDALTYDLLRKDTPFWAELRGALHAGVLHHRALPLLRELRPQLIYERLSLFGTAGAALARDLNVPLVLEVNAPLSDEQARHRTLTFTRTAREIERRVLQAAAMVITVSPELERWAIRAGVAPERVQTVPNGVRSERFGAAAGEREAVRETLGLSGRPVVGFVGTLKPWHDTETLVRAVAALRRRGSDAVLLVVGDGPGRAGIEALAASEGIGDSTLLAGPVSSDRIPGLLAAMDVAVAPYAAAEPFYFSPLKLFEYLAAGVPVVAAAVGEIPECIRPWRTGLLYRPGDVSALAEAMGALLADPARACLLGARGREHAQRHHSWRRNAERILELACASPELRIAS
ncbi:MAG: glycosyltransferase family 4 protein [Actinomycetota bacterium]|nr:glycosyltransferase family 4 protein [Actinomycetota bacterium]